MPEQQASNAGKSFAERFAKKPAVTSQQLQAPAAPATPAVPDTGTAAPSIHPSL